MATLQQLYAILDISFDLTPAQIKNAAQLSCHFDKFYPQAQHFHACKFCEEMYPQLVKAACGCVFCTRCLYNELPSIPISRCPVCALTANYVIPTKQKVAQFNFQFAQKSVTQESLSISQQIKVLELYPLSTANEECQIVQQSKVYCRNHQIFGGNCQELLNCDFQLYGEHLSSCNFEPRPESYSDKSGLSGIVSHNQMIYASDFYTPNVVNLFTMQSTANIAFVPQNRAPVIFHLIVRNLIFQEQEIDLKEQVFQNIQIIAFPNPLESSDISSFVQIAAGLKIIFPDGSVQNFEFWVTPEQLRQQIMRFSIRVDARMLGKYQFDLRYMSMMKNNTIIATTKSIQKICVFSPASCLSVLDASESPFYNIYKHRLQIAVQIVQKGLEYSFQQTELPDLNFHDVEALMTYGIFSTHLYDALVFIIALKNYAMKQPNSRLIVSTNLIQIVCELMDRFQLCSSVQKAAVLLIQVIMSNQPDINIMSIKAPGLFGRLRRIKNDFQSDVIDSVLNQLFKVSVPGIECQQEIEKTE
ncbi:hypothetical protein SS50377_27862 [Spironucleus salmonicida]|uniref:RING-type domain-containing protein n=1 Tax=Spironucleus salmonicida TaxID=348837 RepID=V6LYM1_9EUKA|nr:hypothetical protein SS50377_27862 [Spironucleus salmonicida]|eukprot:EST48821.1 hypothetical protein SS50377_10917 [Spironucleus salmonicida]